MRKSGLFAIIVIVFALVVSACGKKENDNAGNNNAGKDNAATASAPADTKVYHFATDASYPPMENMDKDKIVGFDVDFLDAVMKEAGLQYDIKNIGWETLLTSVQQGTEFDGGISAMSITDKRKETYDFSPAYFESTNMILVKEDSTIANALDLKDKKVAVQTGTTADTLMTGIMGEGSSDLKRFESNALAFMEMNNNGVDAVVADIAVVQEYLKSNPKAKYKSIIDRENFASEYYGIAFPKGSELATKLAPAVKTVLESDKYKEIYAKWIGGEPDLTGVLNQK
ncbi:basic amino acid ABC transporter substrate-binding protein [Cohnella yongneupensis]|uniref:Basic amino acid ABC transporter substrate-binding protein n=1 Tax=Cohnella yongneupensis TaxID=425006 RepID=A0ABW0QVZ5_9BACL